MTYTSALILGDSITIDLYPANDYALRFARAPLSSRLGAGSILFRNNNAVFPHFAGRDLATEFGIAPEKFLNLSVDGAVPTDVLYDQLPRVSPSEDRTFAAVTAGGNSLLQMLHTESNPDPDDPRVDDTVEELREVIRAVKRVRPNGVIALGTVYDPTDGTWQLPANYGPSGRLEAQAHWLNRLNDAIRRIAREESVALVDIHDHFQGHGWMKEESWYYAPAPFEPNLDGASEVRRLFLEAAIAAA